MRLKMAIAMLAAAGFAAAGVVSADGEKTPPGGRKAAGKGQGKRGERGRGEAAASRDAKFSAWDKDSNGSLSRGEYPGHRATSVPWTRTCLHASLGRRLLNRATRPIATDITRRLDDIIRDSGTRMERIGSEAALGGLFTITRLTTPAA